MFVAEQGDRSRPLETHPILGVADSVSFAPDRAPEYARRFAPRHWGVVEATSRDPDGRDVSLQAPVPAGVVGVEGAVVVVGLVDIDEHHRQKDGA